MERDDSRTVRERIERAVDLGRFAVLATQRDGQPHASLVAYTPVGGICCLAFATYRSTLKFRSLIESGRVAVLIDVRDPAEQAGGARVVLTAHGEASEASQQERAALTESLLARHPALDGFVRSDGCALVCVSVLIYEVVTGIDDVSWYEVPNEESVPDEGR